MITQYLNAAMNKARYEILQDDNTFYGEIPGFEGLYANENTLEGCRKELESTLEDWILLSISKGIALPAIDGAELKLPVEIDA